MIFVSNISLTQLNDVVRIISHWVPGPFLIFKIQTLKPYKSSSNTSSTAQGGGGSFKNRKPTGPIGEIGCCESRMAERIH